MIYASDTSGESLTISVPEAGAMLGICRGTAFRLAREGCFPVPVLRVGYQQRVPRAPLMYLLEFGVLPDEGKR